MAFQRLAVAWANNPRRWAILAWAVLRLPLLLVALIALREPILTAIEARFDLIWITLLTIDVLSTPVSRILLAGFAAAAFFAAAKAALRLPGAAVQYFSALLTAIVIAGTVLVATGSNPLWIVPVAVLLAANWAPDAILALFRIPPSLVEKVVALAPGVGEAFLSKRYLDWVSNLASEAPRPHAPYGLQSAALGAAVAAAALAVLVDGAAFLPLERLARSGPDVRVIGHADLNGAALDRSGRYLFATGHGSERLRRYDTEDLTQPPVESDVETSAPQGLAYDPATNEVFLYMHADKAIGVFDGATLALKRSLPVPDLSPGDPWVEHDPRTGSIVIASERDTLSGTPFFVLDRDTGAVRAQSMEEPGNLLLSPETSIVYGSYYRRGSGVGAYDLEANTMSRRVSTPDRIDRMAFDTARRQVLATAPVTAEILAFDPDSLELTDRFRAPFGVRTLAIATGSDAVLAGSLATGRISLISLADHRVLKTWYLGPWLRTIVAHPERGVAYVTSNGTLYELRYADGD